MNPDILPGRPSGHQIITALTAHAHERGLRLEDLVKQISPKSPSTWIKDVARASHPRPVTIERVRALLAGTDLPPRQKYNYSHCPGQKSASANPPVISQRVYRDPCWRCGTRGDLGCEHRPPIEEWSPEMEPAA